MNKSIKHFFSFFFLLLFLLLLFYNLLPRLDPFRLVESVGIGVTSSILPIFNPARANARRADCAPGPGVFVLNCN